MKGRWLEWIVYNNSDLFLSFVTDKDTALESEHLKLKLQLQIRWFLAKPQSSGNV